MRCRWLVVKVIIRFVIVSSLNFSWHSKKIQNESKTRQHYLLFNYILKRIRKNQTHFNLSYQIEMILNNVHDLSSIFLCIDESRLGSFLSFCLIHSTRFQQHTIVYMQWIYISDTNNRRSQCWNGMFSIHLFICSIFFLFYLFLIATK